VCKYNVAIYPKEAAMRTYSIEIDEKIWNYLKSQAEPFEDTPNSVLNRLLFGAGATRPAPTATTPTVEELKIPSRIPRALSQTLEMIYEVKKYKYTRLEASKIIAKRHAVAVQTITDKFCRQLNKTSNEIDKLLTENDLSTLKALLIEKYQLHKDQINSFFEQLKNVA
jgi:hypothetical protein